MKALVINIETTLSLNNNYYILHISYIFYDLSSLKKLIIQTYDIDLYHKAHKIYFNNTNEEKYVLTNNKIRRIIVIINYYINIADIIICYDYAFLKKVLLQEASRNNIKCELTSKNKNQYCILEVYNKIFYKTILLGETINKQNDKLYIIYQELFKLSYLYRNNTNTLLNCLLILRIYYKFVMGKDLEKYDLSIKSLRIYNS